jgi:hypothetical protein
MKPKRIALLDLSAMARAALGALESDDDTAGHEPTQGPVRCTLCGTELPNPSHCAQLDASSAVDDDADLAIEIALDWVRANRDRARRTTPFERSLLRTLQARLRRSGRSLRRGALPKLTPARGRGRAR